MLMLMLTMMSMELLSLLSSVMVMWCAMVILIDLMKRLPSHYSILKKKQSLMSMAMTLLVRSTMLYCSLLILTPILILSMPFSQTPPASTQLLYSMIRHRFQEVSNPLRAASTTFGDLLD